MRAASEPRLPASEWFDLWHWHPAPVHNATPGLDAWRERLRPLFAAWGRIEDAASRLTCPSQTWLVIDLAEPGQDAVYLHTPNPNCDNFPYPFAGVTWGAEPPEGLAEFVAGSVLEVGRSEYDGFLLYWVRRASGAA
jgi:hypothetical protein